MITLTTPHLVKIVLGGTATVPYNKMVLSNVTLNHLDQSINGVIRLTSTTAPTMQALNGTVNIQIATATLTIEVPQLDFYRKINLTGPQNTAIQTLITDNQNAIESGLLSVGVIDGVQAPGT